MSYEKYEEATACYHWQACLFDIGQQLIGRAVMYLKAEKNKTLSLKQNKWKIQRKIAIYRLKYKYIVVLRYLIIQFYWISYNLI